MRKTLMCAVGLCVAGAAQGQLIVGNDQSGSASIYYVDVETGVSTAIYTSTTSEAKPWGMAYDGSTNTLYWNNGGSLYSSPFSMNLTPTLVASLTFNGAATNFVGLAFREGNLLGTRNISTEAVYEINPATGVATQQYVYNSGFDFGGLEVDAATGLLYGLSDSAPAGATRGLYEIDVAGQTETFRAGYPAGETDIDGLAVYNGIAYYVTDGPNTTQPFFYMFDVATGTPLGTIRSPFTGSGTFSAATFIPAPGTVFVMGVAALGMGRRRR